jgi:ribosomal 50S subunit-recycling heat shock protein
VRLDLFLDRVCIFKTRSAAAKAIDGGRVRVNGRAPKRSQRAEVGNEIEIDMPGAPGVERRLRIRVTEVPVGGVSRKNARDCYAVLQDTDEREGA